MAGLKQIFNVDDDEDILELTKVSLEVIGGFTLVQFNSAQDALANLDQHDPDLFLLDVMMPGMDGVELLARIREQPKFKSTPAVFVTAKAGSCFTQELMNKGAAGYVTKPFDPVALPDRLAEFWANSAGENR